MTEPSNDEHPEYFIDDEMVIFVVRRLLTLHCFPDHSTSGYLRTGRAMLLQSPPIFS